MFLQLALISFAVQWLGSVWQLGLGKAIFACLFFIIVIIISALPAMIREWGNIKSAIIVYIIIQLVCLILSLLIPGIGQILAIAFNIFLISRPVTFYKNIGFGFILFFLWFIGLNSILGLFLLTDERGVFSGDLYFSALDWVILIVFLAALARAVYHTVIAYKTVFLHNSKSSDNEHTGIIEKNLLNDTQKINEELQEKEKKTLIPVLLVSLALIIISIIIQPPWKLHGEVFYDLSIQYLNAAPPDYYKAKIAAEKAVRIDSGSLNYKELLSQINEHVSKFEEDEKIGFFKRFWNMMRARF